MTEIARNWEKLPKIERDRKKLKSGIYGIGRDCERLNEIARNCEKLQEIERDCPV
jgi:hypothetical protein